MEVALNHTSHAGIEATAGLLRSTDLFAALEEQELALIGEASEYMDLDAGSVLFRPGSSGNHLYVIQSGEIVIRTELEAGSGREVARFIAGESFGELDLLTRAPRTAYAVAATDGRVVRFPAQDRDFEQVLHGRPEVSAQILFKLLGTVAGRLRSTNKLISDNTPWVRELRRQVFFDKLTGLYNAAYLKEQLVSLGRDPDAGFSLLMMKPDNFKEINDTYGHEAGDNTLRRLATIFGRAMKQQRTAIRYRGNELAALLPQESEQTAAALARDLGDTVRAMDISDCTGGVAVTVTVSFGIGCYPKHRLDTDSLVTDTHALLFQARAAGGDRILQLEAAS
ncbi:MAG: GGDEF domain-containing protein [Spirochaetaceae bacterium]|nr:MAG: GGDEF domain-containing protein [Spirochaetaceae bacterium]